MPRNYLLYCTDLLLPAPGREEEDVRVLVVPARLIESFRMDDDYRSTSAVLCCNGEAYS